MTDMTVAQTILQQLGGNKFLAMTGARHLVGGESHLSMLVPNARCNGKRVRLVAITLEPSDTYTVEAKDYGTRQQSLFVTRGRREDVYCEDLQRVFTELTGLYTHL